MNVEKAVAERRNLLSRCMLTVPQNPTFLENGIVTDKRFRLPWVKVKQEKEFLEEEAGGATLAANVLVNLSGRSTLKLEEYSAYNGNDCDEVIPSSNPNSPDTFISDQKLPQTATPDIFSENCSKVDLTQYCTVLENLLIEMVEEENHLRKLRKKLPSISTLKKRLKPVQVKDPLSSYIKHYGKQDLKFSDKAVTPMLEGISYSNIFMEQFESLTLPEIHSAEKVLEEEDAVTPHMSKTDKILEDIVTPPCSQTAVSHNEEIAKLSTTVLGAQEEIQTGAEDDVGELIQTCLHPTQNSHKPEVLCFSPISTGTASFLHVNEIILTEDDKFCDKATLDIPVEESGEPTLRIPKIPLLDVHKIPEEDSPSTSLLNDKEKQLLSVKTFTSEKFCDEIQASRLPEPSGNGVEECFCKVESFSNDCPVNKARDITDAKPCVNLGKTELSLPWDVIKYGSGVKDTSKMFAQLLVDGDCEITVKDVEQVETYSSSDIYDWKDPILSLELDAPTLNVEDPVTFNGCKNTVTNKGCNKKSATYMECKDPVTNKTEVGACKTKLPRVGSDPLDDFMALRMNKFSVDVPAKIEKKQNVDVPLEPKDVTITKPVMMKNSRSVNQGRKKTKHHVVSVKLTDDFEQILDLLTEKASYMMHALKLSGDVAQSCSFETLTPDMTRFLLKQKEKQIQDENSDVSDDTYRNIVGLHALSGAADITANCCLESGIAYISAIQDKYNTILKGLLTDVRQKLFEVKASFIKRQVHHPKVVTLCKEIEVWLKKKRAKSGGDTEQKILVLVKRDLASLQACLKSALGLGHLLVPEILTSSCSENIIKSLDEHNCLIAYSGLVDDHFPWAQFCLVVEYEYQSDSVWKDNCERQNIRHIALKLNAEDKSEPSTELNWRSDNNGEQISLIASQTVTKNIELLQILEARHNVVLIERDYSLIDGCNQLYFPDIDVDEGCGIVLSLLTDLRDDCSVQALVTKILALSLKLTSCWILLYSDRPNCYQFPGVVVSNLTKLEATIANLATKKEDLNVKVLMCSDLSEVAGNIRGISEHSMTSNRERPSGDWLSRQWFTEEVSQEEKFLIMMPPVTSFNAQLMLEKFSSKELLSSELQDLSARLPWIPEKILKLLLKVANNEYGLHLQDYKTETRKVQNIPSSLHENEELQSSYENETDYYTKDCRIEEMETNLEETNKSEASDYIERVSNTAIDNENESKTDQNTNQNTESLYYSNSEVQTRPHTNSLSEASCPKVNGDWSQLDNFINAKSDPPAKEKLNRFYQSCQFDYHDSRTNLQAEPKHLPNDIIHANRDSNEVIKDQQDQFEFETYPQPVEGHMTNKTVEQRKEIILKQDINLKFLNSINRPDDSKSNYHISLNQMYGSSGQEDEHLTPGNSDITRHGIDFSKETTNTGKNNFCETSLDQGLNYYDASGFKYSKMMIGRNGNHECQTDNQKTTRTAGDCIDNSHSYSRQMSSEHNQTKHDNNIQPTNRFDSGRVNDHWYNMESLLSKKQNTAHLLGTETDTGIIQKDYPLSVLMNHTLEPLDDEVTSQTEDHRGIQRSMRTPFADHGKYFDFVESSAPLINGAEDSTKSKYFPAENHLSGGKSNIMASETVNRKFQYLFGGNVDKNVTRFGHKFLSTVDETGSMQHKENQHSFDGYVGPNWLNQGAPNNHIDLKSKTAEHIPSTRFDTSEECLNKFNLDQFTNYPSYNLNVPSIPNRPDYQNDTDLDTNSRKLPENCSVEDKFYINPQIGRLSHPPKFIDVHQPKTTEHVRTLEDDLRETTRKFLANSQQFSRFNSSNSRHNLQKLSIGLATPLHRDKNVGRTPERHQEESSTLSNRPLVETAHRVDTGPSRDREQVNPNVTRTPRAAVNHGHRQEPCVEQEQKARMKLSPWTTDDSPPMDLDFDEAIPLRAEFRNRAVFTSQTPKKKRKLTYQAVPGKKGQTKLVFQ